MVSFFQGDAQEPIWFRLWIDDQTLVRRSEMRAQMHFMDTDYSDFNAPAAIEAPAG